MNEQDLRDCFAMFAMMTKTFGGNYEKEDAESCYVIADAMLEARKPREDGILAIKPKRKPK